DFEVAAGDADPAKTKWVTDFRASNFPGAEVGKILRELKGEKANIGLVGLDDGGLSATHLQQLQKELPTATLKDATRLFDDLLQAKSEEELIKMRNTSEIFRRVFAEVEARLYPGIHKREVQGQVAKFTKIYGCYNPGINVWLSGSTECFQPRDVMSVFFESPGPSRYWAEVSHSYSFGAPPNDVQQHWRLWNEAFSKALQAAKPGAMQRGVLDAFMSIMTPHGYKLASEAGGSWHMHRIGIDAVEGKWWNPAKDIELKENEVFTFHPSLSFHNSKEARRLGAVYMCDSILVTSRGGERLTFPDDKIVELEF
ncbi:MAG: M24 family metallopeptidase, partial [Proteobacteria bacterium]|nr:M24 family metallopeptidase [Pseudomonadota bacterium]